MDLKSVLPKSRCVKLRPKVEQGDCLNGKSSSLLWVPWTRPIASNGQKFPFAARERESHLWISRVFFLRTGALSRIPKSQAKSLLQVSVDDHKAGTKWVLESRDLPLLTPKWHLAQMGASDSQQLNYLRHAGSPIIISSFTISIKDLQCIASDGWA